MDTIEENKTENVKPNQVYVEEHQNVNLEPLNNDEGENQIKTDNNEIVVEIVSENAKSVNDKEQVVQLPHQYNHFEAFVFIMLGLSSILGWNAILNGLDFYFHQYPDYNPPLSFGVPQKTGQVIIGLISPHLIKRYKIETLNTIGLAGVAVCALLLTIVAYLLPNLAGFILCEIICFMVGVFGSFAQYAQIGLVNVTILRYIVLYWGGTALSGVTMNILMAISYLSFPQTVSDPYEKEMNLMKACYLFNGITFLLVTIIIVLTYVLVRKPYIKNEVYPRVKEEQLKQLAIPMIQQIKKGFKISPIYPTLLLIIYIQDFSLFPGVSVFMHRFRTPGTLQTSWGSLLMLSLFNVGDLIGKFGAGIKVLVRKKVVFIMTMLRFLFFASFICIALKVNCNTFLLSDWFDTINMLLFSLTNGFITAACFSLAPREAKNAVEEQLLGFIPNFALQLGLMIGSFIGPVFDLLPYEYDGCPQLYPK